MMRSNSVPKAKKQNILMVDDNAKGMSARRSVLVDLGYSVTISTDACAMLEEHPEMDFDLVITDFKMKSMPGIDFINAVRSVKPAMPLVLLSGVVEALGLTETNTGADVVIQKSANEVPHLTRVVKRLMSKALKRPPVSQGKARAKSAGSR